MQLLHNSYNYFWGQDFKSHIVIGTVTETFSINHSILKNQNWSTELSGSYTIKNIFS